MSEPTGSPAGGHGSGDTDVVELYVDALATFGNAVRDIADHEWDLPTPSTEWDVKQVVAHVVLGEAHLPTVLDGTTTTTQATFSVELLGSNPLAAWRGTALRAIEAARAPGVVDRLLDLDLGQVTGAQLLGYRISDNVVHAWDLRVAVGRPMPIADEHAAWLLDFWHPMALSLATSGFFAPAVAPRSEAAGDRLVALLGRTPPPN